MDLHDKKKAATQEPQIEKNTHFLQALGHALEGIGQLLVRERNMRFHIVAAIVVWCRFGGGGVCHCDWCVDFPTIHLAKFADDY